MCSKGLELYLYMCWTKLTKIFIQKDIKSQVYIYTRLYTANSIGATILSLQKKNKKIIEAVETK